MTAPGANPDGLLAAAQWGGLAPGAAPAVAGLEAQLFAGDDPWPESAFLAELANPANHYVGLVIPGGGHPEGTDRVLAYGGITRLGPMGEPEYEIHTIAVDPVLRRRGIGAALLGRLLGVADAAPGPVYLEVRTDNEAAIGLYAAHGFDTVGLRKRYYRQSGADAYTMCRPAPARP